MTLRLYTDVHIHRHIVTGLIHRGVDVLTAQEDGARRLPDPELLRRATALGRTFVSHDEDLLQEAQRCQEAHEHFAGLIYAHPLRITVGQAIEELEIMAKVYEPEDIQDRVEYIPLRS